MAGGALNIESLEGIGEIYNGIGNIITPGAQILANTPTRASDQYNVQFGTTTNNNSNSMYLIAFIFAIIAIAMVLIFKTDAKPNTTAIK